MLKAWDEEDGEEEDGKEEDGKEEAEEEEVVQWAEPRPRENS